MATLKCGPVPATELANFFLERQEVMTAMLRRVQGIENELGIRCSHDHTRLV